MLLPVSYPRPALINLVFLAWLARITSPLEELLRGHGRVVEVRRQREAVPRPGLGGHHPVVLGRQHVRAAVAACCTFQAGGAYPERRKPRILDQKQVEHTVGAGGQMVAAIGKIQTYTRES